MKYSKGDFVVYGTNGICRIDDVETMTFPMETREHTYYILRPIASKNNTLFVPDHKEELISKMRYVLKKEEIDEILEGAAGSETKWIDDKNQRHSLYKSIIAAGDAQGLLSLIRCIYEKKCTLMQAGKKLTSADSGLLESAEKLVKEEFAFALEIPEDSVADYIASKIGEHI
ncbi:MAG: CarD family transcriptional regulator [Clostridia bacterium]|nr:CarD family transcriptional regulator [Clostridia bacterium]